MAFILFVENYTLCSGIQKSGEHLVIRVKNLH